MRPLVFASLLAFVGCSSTPGSGDAAVPLTPFTGTEGQPIKVENAIDILIVPVVANGVMGTAVVDTGNPAVALDPSSFPGANLPDGSGPVTSLDVGVLGFPGATVVGANLIESPDPTLPLGGSLGCVVLCDFAVSLNYRDAELTLGRGPTPANVASPGSVSTFELLGGGLFTLTDVPGNVLFPASRIVLGITLEGTPHPFVVDTGSSFMTLRNAVFSDLVADGRKVIGGIGTATVGMESTSSIARLRSVDIGGATVEGAVGANDPSVEDTLDDIAQEIGSPVDGLVGGSFLREFFVTVDYPNDQLTLQRYTKGGPTFDAFDRVGVAIEPADGGTPPTVAYVFAGTAAEKLGVAVGDVVVSIDGHPLASLGATAMTTLLSGNVGSSKTVEFGKAASASVSMRSVSIAVEDVLPL